MNFDNQNNEINQVIWNEIWFGFNSTEEIIKIIHDNFFDEEVPNDNELKKIIAEFFKIKDNTQEKWKNPTDWNRLSKAFDELNGNGIISLHNAGLTKDDCTAMVTELFKSFDNDSNIINGYCTYNEQDLEDLAPIFGDDKIPQGYLLLSFGDILGNNSKGIEIGKTIVRTLNKHGLQTHWNESIEGRIKIKNIKWEKPGTTDSWLDELNNSVVIIEDKRLNK